MKALPSGRYASIVSTSVFFTPHTSVSTAPGLSRAACAFTNATLASGCRHKMITSASSKGASPASSYAAYTVARAIACARV